jgi:hypothetical protein
MNEVEEASVVAVEEAIVEVESADKAKVVEAMND